eukprot:jgi/Mesvir1/21851/Mv04230-RA.1
MDPGKPRRAGAPELVARRGSKNRVMQALMVAVLIAVGSLLLLTMRSASQGQLFAVSNSPNRGSHLLSGVEDTLHLPDPALELLNRGQVGGEDDDDDDDGDDDEDSSDGDMEDGAGDKEGEVDGQEDPMSILQLEAHLEEDVIESPPAPDSRAWDDPLLVGQVHPFWGHHEGDPKEQSESSAVPARPLSAEEHARLVAEEVRMVVTGGSSEHDADGSSSQGGSASSTDGNRDSSAHNEAGVNANEGSDGARVGGLESESQQAAAQEALVRVVTGEVLEGTQGDERGEEEEVDAAGTQQGRGAGADAAAGGEAGAAPGRLGKGGAPGRKKPAQRLRPGSPEPVRKLYPYDRNFTGPAPLEEDRIRCLGSMYPWSPFREDPFVGLASKAVASSKRAVRQQQQQPRGRRGRGRDGVADAGTVEGALGPEGHVHTDVIHAYVQAQHAVAQDTGGKARAAGSQDHDSDQLAEPVLTSLSRSQWANGRFADTVSPPMSTTTASATTSSRDNRAGANAGPAARASGDSSPSMGNPSSANAAKSRPVRANSNGAGGGAARGPAVAAQPVPRAQGGRAVSGGSQGRPANGVVKEGPLQDGGSGDARGGAGHQASSHNNVGGGGSSHSNGLGRGVRQDTVEPRPTRGPRRAGPDGVATSRRRLLAHGVTLRKFCSGVRAGQASKDEHALAACLKRDECGHKSDLIYKTLQSLHGFEIFNRMPRCLTVAREANCSSMEGNPETSIEGDFTLIPQRQLTAKHATCAIVANGPVMTKWGFGKIIDRHEAVFRFNMVPIKGFAEYVGTKTTYRLFNRWRAMKLARGDWPHGRTSAGDEKWIFWSYRSNTFLDAISKAYKRDVYLTSPHFQRWMVATYFSIMKDMGRIGMGAYKCPLNLSSGVHAVFLASKLCHVVNLFGFSYTERMLASNAGHYNRKHMMHRDHSWSFDALLLRLFRYSRTINICSAVG